MTTAIVPEFEEPDLDMLALAAEWVERIEGPHSLDERSAFDTWLAERPAHEFAYWEMLALRDVAKPVAVDAAERDRVRPPRNHRRLVAIAASVAFVGLITALVPDAVMRIRADKVTGTGETRDLTLPDGSRVALNSNSAVAVGYAGRQRQIALLKGEAFFDVARDPTRPFTVMAGGARVRVLGTHFNVRIDGDRTTVTVREGRVSFGVRDARAGQLLLTTGQQAFVESGAVQRQPVYDPTAAFAWRNGQIIFYRARFREVINEIERYRPGEIFVLSSGIGSRTISGAFNARTPDVALVNATKIIGARMMTLPGGIVLIYD